jgi:hypothetical protein
VNVYDLMPVNGKKPGPAYFAKRGTPLGPQDFVNQAGQHPNGVEWNKIKLEPTMNNNKPKIEAIADETYGAKSDPLNKSLYNLDLSLNRFLKLSDKLKVLYQGNF